MKPNIDPANCILVQDVKSSQSSPNPHDQMTSDGSIGGPNGLNPAGIIGQNLNSGSTLLPTEDSLQTSTLDHGYTTSHQFYQQSLQYQDQQLQQPQIQPSIMELKDFNVMHHSTIPPYQFWNIEFRNKHPSFIQFNLTLPWGANFAIYGRRNVVPSITQHDFVEFIKGGRLDHHRLRRKRDVVDDITIRYERTHDMLADGRETRNIDNKKSSSKINQEVSFLENDMSSNPESRSLLKSSAFLHLTPSEEHIISKRSSDLPKIDMETMMVNVTLMQYLDVGRWFLSIYNDELLAHPVQLIVAEAEGIITSCPNECSGHGSCYLGKCDCIDGFQGIDCSKSVCPVLCSAHGHYGGGVCHCEEGWKGSECDIPVAECENPTCSNHGRCIEGECHCERGFKGPFCEQREYLKSFI